MGFNYVHWIRAEYGMFIADEYRLSIGMGIGINYPRFIKTIIPVETAEHVSAGVVSRGL